MTLEPAPVGTPVAESAKENDPIKVKTFYDFMSSLASKRLAITCWAEWKFLSIGAALLPIDVGRATWVFTWCVVIACVYLLSETVRNFSENRVLEKRALSVDLLAAMEKIRGT